MAKFQDAFAVVMVIEGGYANDPDDSGGETYKGISRNNFPAWEGWKIIDAIKSKKPQQLDYCLKIDATLQAAVLKFYKTNFWDVLGLDYVTNQPIATELFDTGVNMGTGVAAVFLQDALNITNRNGQDYPDLVVDAKIGPATIKALNQHPRPADVLKTLNILQGGRYIEICRRDPKKEKFYRSWLSRVSLN